MSGSVRRRLTAALSSGTRRLAWPAVVAALLAIPAQAASLAPPRLPVTGAALIDAATGELLYGRAPEAELPIASTTKIMTALVTLQRVHRLGRVFAQNDWVAAPADSQIGLVPGERMNVHDLLVAMLLPSADDAAEDLAYNVGGGSVGRFVAMMNADARSLGLRHTHYSTPIGLDTPGNYSSPADLVRLAAYVMRYSPFFRRTVAERSAVLDSGRYRRVVVNRNDLVARYGWIDGVKTGHTLDAGYVLVASGHRDGMTLIDAVLGTPSEAARDAGALSLLDYGFTAFQRVVPIRRGEVMARPAAATGPSGRVAVVAAAGFERVVPRGERLAVRVLVPHRLDGPLARGAVVGHALVLAGGHVRASGRPPSGAHVLARIALELTRALPAPSTVAQATRFLTRPPTLIVLGAAFAAVAFAVFRRRGSGAMATGHLEEG